MFYRLPVCVAILCFALAAQTQPQVTGFNRDIRPILSDRCYACHGPDKAKRMTNLRFDTEEGAKQELGGNRFAIVAGDPEHSEMIKRITAPNKALRMPPASSGLVLLDREVDLIRTWIAQGAQWEKFWSFIPPQRLVVPEVKDRTWPSNPIDNFVLSQLEREGLKPVPSAGKAALIRRVTLDLTGLPPTLEEMDAFQHDSASNAYERVVDRLLASPRFGEQMAIRWLDAARYADTNGYQTDGERSMWRWRDWVINAFNRNMPFDEFTIEQIAGDLLPNATLDQRIATGFNRNHRGNGEGGIVPEEYRVEYVVDRVSTAGTVWLGLTVGCARCHDHKYDPISQKEFYQLSAYFNNIPEHGNAQKYGNSAPLIKAPTPDQQIRMRDLNLQVAEAEKHFADLQTAISEAQREWEASLQETAQRLQWFPSRSLAVSYPLETSFDGKSVVDAGKGADIGFYDKFTLAAWINPAAPDGAILTRTKDVPEATGITVMLKNGKVQMNLVQRWLDDSLRVETASAIDLHRWHHVAVTYDGSRFAEGVRIYVDGVSQKLTVNLDLLNQDFKSEERWRIGGGGGPEQRFRGKIDEVRIYRTALTPGEAAVLATRDPIDELAAIDRRKRTAAQSDKVRLCYLNQYAPAPMRESWTLVQDLHEKRDSFGDSLPTVMVMQENPAPRDTFLLIRGAYDHPGEKVGRGVPSMLPPLPGGVTNNRLGFARWLVDAGNPLTARVAVNRFWQQYFGIGIVKTVDNFGSQGEWPSNPGLLDWLAAEFVRSGWNVKAIQKTIVMSATYRQSSEVSPEQLQGDPENRLLARGPRYRLPAAVLRDQALAISGLLVEKIGGPSVKPYQPAGLWKELSGGTDYPQDKGEGLYRRSLYTFWKRASPPPFMVTFDSAERETCSVYENRTNTPLQALDLMNDVTFIEASRVLAERMIKEGGKKPAERIAYAFRLATARVPTEKESSILLNSLQYDLDRFQTEPADAVKLSSQGESPRVGQTDSSELAAYTTVANLILNLDETVTKQ